MNEFVVVPQTEADFQYIKETLIAKYNFVDGDSLDEALATMILHADNTKSGFPLSYFGERIQKLIANKIAYGKVQAIIAREQAKASKQAETPKIESASDEHPQNAPGS